MPSHTPRILIVDDEPELLNIFSAWVKACGYDTRTASNGAEAIELMQQQSIDVIISDIRMPIMDGLTMLRRLHELHLTVPGIILVSGFGHVERREVHALGVERLIEKPLRRQHLLGALESSLAALPERWAAPPETPATESITATFPSLTCQSGTSCGFLLGRGGFCFPANTPLQDGATIAIDMVFEEQRHALRGRGEVQWYRRQCGCAGVSFSFLEPESRTWIIDHIGRIRPRSFIPACEGGPVEQAVHLASRSQGTRQPVVR